MVSNPPSPCEPAGGVDPATGGNWQVAEEAWLYQPQVYPTADGWIGPDSNAEYHSASFSAPVAASHVDGNLTAYETAFDAQVPVILVPTCWIPRRSRRTSSPPFPARFQSVRWAISSPRTCRSAPETSPVASCRGVTPPRNVGVATTCVERQVGDLSSIPAPPGSTATRDMYCWRATNQMRRSQP